MTFLSPGSEGEICVWSVCTGSNKLTSGAPFTEQGGQSPKSAHISGSARFDQRWNCHGGGGEKDGGRRWGAGWFKERRQNVPGSPGVSRQTVLSAALPLLAVTGAARRSLEPELHAPRNAPRAKTMLLDKTQTRLILKPAALFTNTGAVYYPHYCCLILTTSQNIIFHTRPELSPAPRNV